MKRAAGTRRKPDPELERAHAAARAGDLTQAETLYRRVIKRKARSAEAHYNLGLVLVQSGEPGAAIEPLRRAAQLEPTKPECHYALAEQLRASREFNAAIDAYNKGRWLDPDHANADTEVAILLEVRGDTDKALEAVERALSADPTLPQARVLSIRLRLRDSQPDEATLRGWCDSLRSLASTENDRLRAFTLDVLIDVCERLKDFEASWHAIIECNEADRAALGSALAPPKAREEYLQAVDASAQVMTPERAQRWRDEKPEDGLPAPTLLIGFPRSGTTMTERALESHPRVRSIEELPTFELTRDQVLRLLPPGLVSTTPIFDLYDHLTPDHIAALRQTYWKNALGSLGLERPPADTVVLDKMPLRISDLPFVNRIFPESRVLVALRDPRDVCLSCLRQRLSNNIQMSFMLSLEDIARLYSHVMSSWIRNKGTYTLQTLEIRYEDTVTEFEPRIRAMLKFVGLEFDEAVLSFHKRTDRIHSTPSYHAVRQKVSKRAVGRWRRYTDQLAPVLATLEPFVEAFGYEASPPHNAG